MYKKRMTQAVLATVLGFTISAHAEILVILPETGTMASAADSIKRGFVEANQQAGNKYVIRFANINQTPLSTILKTQVSKKTKLVVGPLDKQNVEELIRLEPQVTTIALNQVNLRAKGVYQFALAKEEDALALTKRMQWDGIEKIIVLREDASKNQTQSFYDAMLQLWGDKIELKDKLPMFSRAKQGILLLGSNEWLLKQNLPKKQIYTLPYAINEKVKLPEGLVYCDTPALYVGQWQDVILAYQKQPVSLPFQRLIAFGGDAWQIADVLQTQKNSNIIEFQGRTGKIRIVGDILERQPQCFKAESSGQQTAL